MDSSPGLPTSEYLDSLICVLKKHEIGYFKSPQFEFTLPQRVQVSTPLMPDWDENKALASIKSQVSSLYGN